jgi:hypothetical protein
VERCLYVRILRKGLRRRALKYYLLHPIKWAKIHRGSDAARWHHLLLDYSRYPESETLPDSVRIAYQNVRAYSEDELKALKALNEDLLKYAEAYPSEFEKMRRAEGLDPGFSAKTAERETFVKLESCILAEYPSEALAQMLIEEYRLDADRAQSLLTLHDLKKPMYTRHIRFWRPLSLTVAVGAIIGNTLPMEAFLAVGFTPDQYKSFLGNWARWLVSILVVLLVLRAFAGLWWLLAQRPMNRRYEFCGRILRLVAMEVNFNRGSAEAGQPTSASHEAETTGPP